MLQKQRFLDIVLVCLLRDFYFIKKRFYQKTISLEETLLQLSEAKLNIGKNQPKGFKKDVFIQIPIKSPDKNGTGNDWLTYGIQLSRVKDINGAIYTLSVAVGKNPELWQVYYNVALIWLDQEKYHAALWAINVAINKKPSFYHSYFLKARILEHSEQYENALEAVQQAIAEAKKESKDDFTVYKARGDIFLDLKQYDEAIADYTQVIAITPQDALTYSNRGDAYNAKGKTDSAIADYTQAIAINPQDALTYSNRGFAYYMQGKTDLAIDDCNKAIEINFQLASAYFNRGFAYKLKGNKQQAIKDLETAKQLYQQQGNTQNAQKAQELLNKL
jgi:tetratricopeptide (TPR) repeat protein